jgi:hypothetical protein
VIGAIQQEWITFWRSTKKGAAKTAAPDFSEPKSL